MDAPPPTPPAVPPPTTPEPAPRVGLWRGRYVTGRARKPIVPLTAALVLLVAAIAYLITWVRPAPDLEVVQLWAVGSLARPFLLQSVSQADGDRRAFSDATRNAFARVSGREAAVFRNPTDVLSAIDARSPDRTFVAYFCARACCDPEDPKTVWLLPDDAHTGTFTRRPGWLDLREIFLRLARNPVGRTLLVLDLHPVKADPQFGLFSDDVASAVREEFARFPDNPFLLLASCDDSQKPLSSETLGRSAFSFYLEEGLRGWADVAAPGETADGRVTVRELAAYVREHVARWAQKNRGTRQSPVLLGRESDDFPLVILPRGRRQPHLALPTADNMPPKYPTWLLDGWKQRDGLRREGVGREAPRVLSQIETALMRAEHDWRAGGDSAQARAALTEALEVLHTRLGPLRSIPRPRPASLALEAAGGRVPDTVLEVPLKALIASRAAPPPGQKPTETEAESTRSIAGFYAALKPTTDFDLASAVFRAAADAKEPDRQTLDFLDRLLRTRQPRPLYAETQTLHRLAELAPRDWRSDTARLALRVTRRGELAASRSESFAWVRPLLSTAEAIRQDGEALLFARGYASLDEADNLLRSADTALDAVLTASDTVEHARHLIDEALTRLPATLPFLTGDPAFEAAWFDAARDARALVNALSLPAPTDASESLERIGAIERPAAALDAELATLRRPFAVTRLDSLSAADRSVTPETYDAISDLLNTPFPDAPHRVSLWKSLLAVDRRLNEETLALDVNDGPSLRNRPTALDTTSPEQTLVKVRLRARGAVELLALAGLPTDDLTPLRETLDAPSAPALPLLARAWSKLPGRLAKEADFATADRVGRLISPNALAPELDAPETNPTRRLRVTEFAAFRGWLADQFAHRARDLDGSPFDASAAEEYRDDDRPTSDVVVDAGNTVTTLDPARPVARLPLQFRLTGPPAEATAKVDVVTADTDWLEVKRGSPWPAKNSPFPAVETMPLAFDLALTSPGSLEVPLEVRLRPEGDATTTPVPLGFLIRSRLGGQVYHQRVRLDLVPASRQLQIVLSTDPARPTTPLGELRLRPVKDVPGYFLYIKNPTEADRPVLVQLLDGGVLVPGCEVAVTVKARDFKKVSFGTPSAKPEADFVAVRGGLQWRVLDASDPTKVLTEASPPVSVALARDYVRVVDARFEPPGPVNDGKARLSFRLRAVGPIVGPPCPVELVLSPDRVPGLLAPGEGTFRASLAAEGDEALLIAEGVRLDERDDEQGYVELTVDGVERAFVFRTTFARRGEPTTPRLDDHPAVRLRASASAYAGAPYEVTTAIDNAPPGARLELNLGRQTPGGFQTDLKRDLRAEKDTIRFNPRGVGDSIRFEASVGDPSVPFDVRRIRGRRELRARLLNAENVKEAEDTLTVLFDDSPPASVKLVDVPKYALKGAPLEIRAVGAVPAAGIKKVAVFIGRPVDGKLPPNAVLTDARPLDVSRTSWGVKLPVPDDKKGPLDVSVQFVSGVGLSSFDTATVEVVDTIPIEPGQLQGKVVEGPRPQPGLDLIVTDSKGAEKARAKTDNSGRFAFPSLPPGPYRIICLKPTPPTRGEAQAIVTPGKVAEVTVEMLRTR